MPLFMSKLPCMTLLVTTVRKQPPAHHTPTSKLAYTHQTDPSIALTSCDGSRKQGKQQIWQVVSKFIYLLMYLHVHIPQSGAIGNHRIEQFIVLIVTYVTQAYFVHQPVSVPNINPPFRTTLALQKHVPALVDLQPILYLLFHLTYIVLRTHTGNLEVMNMNRS